MYYLEVLVALFCGSLLDVTGFPSVNQRNGGAQLAQDRTPINNTDVFNCQGLPLEPQLHLHPTDCTRFIQCSNGMAYDMPCAPCNETDRCPSGYLEWDGVLIGGNLPSCIWPEDSTCQNRNPPTTPPTTEAPAPTRPCNASNCEVTIDCRNYTFCERVDKTQDPDLKDEGELVTVECAQGLWPAGIKSDNSGGKVIAGTCLPWSQLPEDRKVQILKECNGKDADGEFIARDNCSPEFQFRNADGSLSSIHSCPVGQVVDIDRKGCVTPCHGSDAFNESCRLLGKC